MALTAGTRLGPYEVVAALGEGGMGEVYRAHDARLDREIALKVLPPAAADDEAARRRLVREARAVASPNHPNICTVHDVGEADGLVYLAMELVEGRSLDALIAEGRLAAEEVRDAGIQIARALAHAHDAGIVHSDLKGAASRCPVRASSLA